MILKKQTIVNRFENESYKLNIMRQCACLVFTKIWFITVQHSLVEQHWFTFLDSMAALQRLIHTHINYKPLRLPYKALSTRLRLDDLSGSAVVQKVVFFFLVDSVDYYSDEPFLLFHASF